MFETHYLFEKTVDSLAKKQKRIASKFSRPLDLQKGNFL